MFLDPSTKPGLNHRDHKVLPDSSLCWAQEQPGANVERKGTIFSQSVSFKPKELLKQQVPIITLLKHTQRHAVSLSNISLNN